MKKYVSLVLCLLLAALLFTGCTGGNGGSSGGGKTSDAAVNEALFGCFGKSADEAVKALGLKDDQKAGDYGYTLGLRVGRANDGNESCHKLRRCGCVRLCGSAEDV